MLIDSKHMFVYIEFCVFLFVSSLSSSSVGIYVTITIAFFVGLNGHTTWTDGEHISVHLFLFVRFFFLYTNKSEPNNSNGKYIGNVRVFRFFYPFYFHANCTEQKKYTKQYNNNRDKLFFFV